VPDRLDPEKVAYWYFRLNGFFEIENFVVHPGRQPHSARTSICSLSAFSTALSACLTT
jgi:hypothetical protein